MRLNRYIEFLLESSKYKYILVYSTEFKSIIRTIEQNADDDNDMQLSVLCRNIIDSEDSESDISMIDIGTGNDMVSFVQSSRIIKKYGKYNEDEYNGELSDENNSFWKEQRSEIKIGKFVKKLVSNTKDSVIETFVNKWKSEVDYLKSDAVIFEEVNGDDIKKWYLYENYSQCNGTLGNSCMRYAECQDYFDIYTKNTEVVSLLILRDRSDSTKISGRALIWTLENGERFMDRVYTTIDSEEHKFYKYAKQQGFIYKQRNKILKGGTSYSVPSEGLVVRLKKIKYDKYPYLDTLICYNYKECYLTSNDIWPTEGVYKCQNTDGTCMSDDVVYSKWQQDHIERKDAVFFEEEDDWVSKEESLFIKSENRYYHPKRADQDVFWCYYEKEWLKDDECYHSETLSTIVKIDNSIKAIINESGETDYFPNSGVYYAEYDGKKYYNKLLLRDPDTNELIPWFVKIKVYWSKHIKNYLSENASKKLHIKIDSGKQLVKKYIDYYKERTPLGTDAKLAKQKINSVKKDLIKDNILKIIENTEPESDEFSSLSPSATKQEVKTSVDMLARYLAEKGYGLYKPYWNKMFYDTTDWDKIGTTDEHERLYTVADSLYDSWYGSIFKYCQDINRTDIEYLNNYIKLLGK